MAAFLDTAPLRTVTDFVAMESAEIGSDWTATEGDDLLADFVAGLLGGFFLAVFAGFFLVFTAGDSASLEL